MKTLRILLSLFIIHSTFFISRAAAQQTTGAIQGRVYLPSADLYLENALITVEGTNRTALTDGIGAYVLGNLPAGPAKVTASFTGYPSRTFTIDIQPGKTTTLDIDILRTPAPKTTGKDDDVVLLDRFVVNADRFETGAALARNEQRFAADIRTVVSADEFGENPSGNIGAFLKNLPGVALVNTNGEARSISIDGVSPDDVPITFAGFSLANAASGSQNRRVELDGVSITSASRMEITFAPTPEIEGRALAGSVNIVPRSAFEFRAPRFEIKTWIIFDGDHFSLAKSPGPHFTPTRKAGPNAAFSYIVPVSKKFGFSVSAGRSYYYNAKQFQRTYWRGSSDGVDNVHFPITNVDNPYLSRIDLEQGSSLNERISLALTADWRISRTDRLSFALQYGYQEINFNNRTLIIAIQNFDAAAANLLTPYYSEGNGYIRQNQMSRRKSGTTYTPTLTWRHYGPKWKMNAGIAYSEATNHYADIPNGYFYSAQADRGNLKIIFDDMQYTGPRRISVTDLGGVNAPINPYSLDALSITNVYTRENDSYEKITNGFFDIRRDFMLGSRIPLFLKAGYNYKQTKRGIDNVDNLDWRYLGADGIPSAAGNDSTTGVMLPFASNDDGAKRFIDPSFSTVPVGFGHPPIEWVDLAKLYQMYQVNPGYFALINNDENIRNLWDVSETIHAGYFRGDLYLFNNRFQIIGGARVESTGIEGRGPWRGNIGGRMQWVKYGAKANVDYTNWFPRVNLVWEITPNRTLVARAAYFESIKRPSWDQYAGQLTMPDRTAAGSATSNRFGIKNAAIKPSTSKTFSAGLDWYFSKDGSITARVYNRVIDKFFVESVEMVSAELLQAYGLDPIAYDGYYAVTQINNPSPATVNGVTISWRQALAFLPKWAQRVVVDASATYQSVSGVGSDYLIDPDGAFRPELYKAGISYAGKHLSLRASYFYMGKTKTGINNSTNVPPYTYTHLLKYQTVNLEGDYRFKNWTLYFKIDNLTNEPTHNFEIYGPNTPALAKMRYLERYAPQYTFGVKAVF